MMADKVPVIKKCTILTFYNNLATLTRAQQMQLENKPEQVIQIEKSPLTFSKKHSFILNEHLNDFYVVKTRRPITDDKALIQIFIVPSAPEITCEP
jgi:hypothetical protein